MHQFALIDCLLGHYQTPSNSLQTDVNTSAPPKEIIRIADTDSRPLTGKKEPIRITEIVARQFV